MRNFGSRYEPLDRSRSIVLVDASQLSSATGAAAGKLQYLGKRYILGTSSHVGNFHPKVALRLNDTEGAVMIGSGNLTSCGWGGNREVGTGWKCGPKHQDRGEWLSDFLDAVLSWCSTDSERDSVLRMTASHPSLRSEKSADAGASRATDIRNQVLFAASLGSQSARLYPKISAQPQSGERFAPHTS